MGFGVSGKKFTSGSILSGSIVSDNTVSLPNVDPANLIDNAGVSKVQAFLEKGSVSIVHLLFEITGSCSRGRRRRRLSSG